MPLMYLRNDDQLLSKVWEICNKVESDKKILVTTHARVIIYNLLAAITDDPHPNWIAYETQRKDALDKQLYKLEERIHEIIKEEKVQKKLSTFDVLHWMIKVIDEICPFRKSQINR